MSQEQISHQENTEQHEENSAPGEQINVQSVDDLLDDIDELLATDSQSFVAGFVQKGGQ